MSTWEIKVLYYGKITCSKSAFTPALDHGLTVGWLARTSFPIDSLVFDLPGMIRASSFLFLSENQEPLSIR